MRGACFSCLTPAIDAPPSGARAVAGSDNEYFKTEERTDLPVREGRTQIWPIREQVGAVRAAQVMTTPPRRRI
jgi:hypothetical protein